MSRKSFSNGKPGEEPDFQAVHHKTRSWFCVYKDGVKLAYGPTLADARKRADSCGGEVRRLVKGKMEVIPVATETP